MEVKVNWIYKKYYDLSFILLPPLILVVLVIVFNDFFQKFNQNEFFVWIVLVVCIDVAHVWSSLFRTYLYPPIFKKYKWLFILTPIGAFLVSWILCSFGWMYFWRVLAYLAVFHFIRQQYGFMKLYYRGEVKSYQKYLDYFLIHYFSIFPMIYWFFHYPRNFNWFLNFEFFTFQSSRTYQLFWYLYIISWVSYLVSIFYDIFITKTININKNLIIFSTAISWYFGIVYFNNDLIFSLLNVISHGIPYLALIFYKNIIQVKESYKSQKLIWIFVFFGLIFLLAFVEEWIWDSFIWKEHFNTIDITLSSNQIALITAILAVPQITHYILDGFIWKFSANFTDNKQHK